MNGDMNLVGEDLKGLPFQKEILLKSKPIQKILTSYPETFGKVESIPGSDKSTCLKLHNT